MKKLVFGIFIALVAASCGSGNSKSGANSNSDSNKMQNDSSKHIISKSQAQQPLTPRRMTLNSVLDSRAIMMIDDFKVDYPDDKNTPKAVSAWYGINDIKAINSLLVAEYNQSKRPDGVRIYFGCNNPPTGTSKLKPDIFLVSTELRSVHDPNLSDHVDYYNHLDGYLPAAEIGVASDDADAYNTNGASLYGSNPPGDTPCPNPGDHYINGADAYAAVRRHCGNSSNNDNSAYNTRSEWFDLCFINSVFNAILDPQSGLNGMRIYFGKRIMKDGTDRDVFVLVPTHDVGGIPTDSYDCLEKLTSFACTIPWTDGIIVKNKHDAHISFSKVDGYDKGELCPYTCN